jgi:hypothetical protein
MFGENSTTSDRGRKRRKREKRRKERKERRKEKERRKREKRERESRQFINHGVIGENYLLITWLWVYYCHRNIVLSNVSS